MNPLQLIIITGYSGSGKSTALAAFEDAGFYCIDNMPVALLPKLLELPLKSSPEIKGLAFVMDMRDRDFIAQYESVLRSLRKSTVQFTLLFLEAEENTLLNRYKETRRQHPLAKGRGLRDSIRDEMTQLQELRKAADKIVNTSHYTVHELKTIIVEFADKYRESSNMRTHVMSFGFKYGVPQEADVVMDVRFLPNPYFIPDLSPLDGESDRVRDFVLGQPETGVFLEKFLSLLHYIIPLYEKEGKSYLTIAVGCTGGRHRSVAVARFVYGALNKPGRQVEMAHRDIDA